MVSDKLQFVRTKRKLYKYTMPFLKVITLLVLIVGLILGLRYTLPLLRMANQIFGGPANIISAIIDPNPHLKTDGSRINILLLGTGGGSHEGPNLTDTMIFISLNTEKKTALFVSVPRDIWIDSLQKRINEAYAIGQEKKPEEKGGLLLAKAVVSEILGQPIQYSLRLDFSGFEKIVDLLGGVTINVESSFTDNLYPIEGKENDDCGGNDPDYKCRYETLTFTKGEQIMDGKTALKFVRSRHAEGGEGSDFARSKRQQKLIFALKDKILQKETLLDTRKLEKLQKTLGDSIDTDIKNNEIDDFVKIALKMKEVQIQNFILDIGDEVNGRIGLLYQPPAYLYTGAWVLRPVGDSWVEVQKKLWEMLQ